MKKWIGYTLTLAMIPILSFGGFGGQDVGKLSPVQVVLVRNSEQVVLLTDTKEQGTGEDVTSAVINMKQTSAAEVFLDTADYLLLGKESGPWVGELKPYLKGKVLACAMEEKTDLKMVTAYLAAHKPEYTIEEAYEGKPVERLSVAGGRYRLEKPEKSKNST